MNISSLLPFGAISALAGMNSKSLVLITIPEHRYNELLSFEKQNIYLIQKLTRLQKRKKRTNRRGKQ